MRKLLLVLVLVVSCFVSFSQYAPTSAKTRFVNGIGLSTKDTASLTNAADTLVIIMGADSVPYVKYKGYWKALAYRGASGVSSVGTNNGSGITGGPITLSGTIAADTSILSTKKWRQKGVDSINALLGLKVNYTDTASMLSPYARSLSLNSYVPYTGATTNIALGNHGLRTDFTQYNTSPTAVDSIARLVWNNTDGTLNLGLKGGNVSLQVGQESVVRVINKSGINLTEANYQAVRVTGAEGQRLKVDLAQGNTEINSLTTIGVVTENINMNSEGFVTTSGLVRNVNTTGSIQGETWADGDVIYVSPTIAGGLTNIKPIAPNYQVTVGYVVYSNSLNGSIFIKTISGFTIDELNNVKVTGINNNYGLFYDSTTALWKNKSIATALGYTPKNYADTLFTNGYTTRGTTKKIIDSLSAITNLKVNISDTASMLSPYQKSANAISSVGLSMPVAFTVSNTPLTSNGTISVTGAGTSSQYVRGDGQLATMPSGGGGGASVNYYLNGSVASGVVGYQQLNNTPVIGAGTNFTLTNTTGYISSFLTDVGNPNKVSIPAGAWSFELFFTKSNTTGSPFFYIELYKYNGSTFTLISSSSATPEYLTGTIANVPDLYLTSLAVPLTTLLVTDRLAIRIFVNTGGNRTITLNTEDSRIGKIVTTFSGGISSINGLAANTQYLSVGTSGTDFSISSSTDTHTFNLPTASATNRGALSSANWTTFNNKIGAGDTATMLSNYRTNINSLIADSVYQAAQIALRVKYIDTANMLSPYTHMGNSFNGNNQLLQLDAGGKVAFAQLPATLMIYKGTWNASTNNPTLANGSGVSGWVYKTTVAGTVNFGGGSIAFLEGDFVIYNGTIWERSVGTDNVVSVSVNGSAAQQGVVAITLPNSSVTNAMLANPKVNISDTASMLTPYKASYYTINQSTDSTYFTIKSLLGTQIDTVRLIGSTLGGSGGGSASGTVNYISKFTSTTALGNSSIFDNATSVGINNITPAASAKLDIASTTQGFLPPRMTNAQRVAIVSPVVGLMVYCTDATEGLYIYKSTGWVSIITL